MLDIVQLTLSFFGREGNLRCREERAGIHEKETVSRDYRWYFVHRNTAQADRKNGLDLHYIVNSNSVSLIQRLPEEMAN